MFDLDHEISIWRAQLLRGDAVSNTEIDELESHLRTSIEELSDSSPGLSPKEVFQVATQRLGSPDDISSEFSKINGKPNMVRRVMWTATGLLVVSLVACVFIASNQSIENVALLRISPPEISPNEGINRIDQKSYELKKRNAADTIGSQSMINDAIATFNSPQEKATAQRILASLDVEYPGHSEILRVSAHQRSSDGDIGLQAVDALTECFAASHTGIDLRVQLVQPTARPNTMSAMYHFCFLAMQVFAAFFFLAMVFLAGFIVFQLVKLLVGLNQRVHTV